MGGHRSKELEKKIEQYLQQVHEKRRQKNRPQTNEATSPSPELTRLAELTHHPEIIAQPRAYARAAQTWAAGIPGEFEPFETRTDSEVEFIQALCQANVCGKHHNGVCKPSCGSGMIIEVKARMASEGCPWAWSRW